jgi:mannose-6-phosphate isomerase-like protein (cupin superfamily)
MKGFVVDIEAESLQNENFRKVLYTDSNTQLVLMSIEPGDDIGEEVHELDQFIRVEKGEGKAVLNGVEHILKDGSAVVVPEGVRHNIINTGSIPLKLYTLYSPPEHEDGTVHTTKADAHRAEEHFDGTTTE